MACVTTDQHRQINLQGVNGAEILRKLYSQLLLYFCSSLPEDINLLKAVLYSKNIITRRQNAGVQRIDDILTIVNSQTQDQIETFFTIVCSDENILTRPNQIEIEALIKEAIKEELGHRYREEPLFTDPEVLNPSSESTALISGVNHIGIEIEDQPIVPETTDSSTVPQEPDECPDPWTKLRSAFTRFAEANLPCCNVMTFITMVLLLPILYYLTTVSGTADGVIIETPWTTQAQSNRTTPTDVISEVTPLPDQMNEITFPVPQNLSVSSPSPLNITNSPRGPSNNTPVTRTRPVVPGNSQQFTPSPINFSNIFEPPKAVVYQITEMRDVDNYRKGICVDKDKTLNMSFSNKEDLWDIAPDCSGKVTGLVFSGPFSLNDIITLLRDFFQNIKHLVFFGGRICAEIDDTSEELDTVPSNNMSLLELRYLKFENITECPKLYKSVESWHTPKLDKLVMQDVFLNEINQKSIENIITTNPQMQAFSLTGYLCKQCLPLGKKLKWPNLKYLNLDVQNPWVPKASEFNNNLLKTSNLHYFKSNILLTERGVKFLKRSSQNLVFLDMAILFNDTRSHFNVSSFKRFANLKHMHFKLQFSNQSVCRVQKSPVLLEGLRILLKRLPGIEEISFASNCNIKPSEWQLPCRDYVYGFDDVWNMKLVTIKRQDVCTSNKG